MEALRFVLRTGKLLDHLIRPTSIIRSADVRSMSTLSDSTPNPLPASFLRGGTSKGIFINRSVLPEERALWDRIFLGIMGSPDPEHGRQLNGMGGGISSLSKICVVGEPSTSQKEQGIQAEYTFVQVGIHDSSTDYSGNCGNLSSMIGVFAVDEGICVPSSSGTRATIRSFNTNTQKIIDTTFPISTNSDSPSALLEIPETEIAGVSGKASTIMMEFVNPAGARTGKLLPTGSPLDHLTISTPSNSERIVRCSCIDASNPSIFFHYSDLAEFLPIADYIKGQGAAAVGETLETLRQAAAVKMGLDPSAQAQPKISIIQEPHTDDDRLKAVDIVMSSLSMGVLHKAVPMTVGLCAGVASNIENTLLWEVIRKSRAGGGNKDMVRIRHPSGVVDVGAQFSPDGEVESAKVVRTGKRLMRGVVWW